MNYRIIGTKKIIKHYTIVKPKVERVHFVEKQSEGSLEDYITGKLFLQKNKGVKARQEESKIQAKREEERKKKTFSHAGINIMTVEGMKTLTLKNA